VVNSHSSVSAHTITVTPSSAG